MEGQSSRSRKKGTHRKSSRKRTPNTNVPMKNETVADSDDDNESVASFASSADFLSDEMVEDGVELSEDFEAKLLDNIELARQKGTKNRRQSLLEIKKSLCQRYAYDLLLNRKESIADVIEKVLKRGHIEDKILASSISSVLCVQLGEGESQSVFASVKPVLLNMIGDDSVLAAARSSASTALGVSCFIGSEELEDTMVCLKTLKACFAKKIPADTSQHVSFASSLLAWGLLLTVASPSVVEENIESCIATMCKLLELGSLNLRLATGETVALVYELARQLNIRLQGPVNTVYSLLRDLANESGRHKGKREKRQQKASFRDFIKSVEHGHPPDVTVKFGQEYIQMTSWTWLRRYNAFKETLGSGTNTHLETNMLLREIFDLGLPATKGVKLTKADKYERQLMNLASSKDRTLRRNQKRDTKRAGCP